MKSVSWFDKIFLFGIWLPHGQLWAIIEESLTHPIFTTTLFQWSTRRSPGTSQRGWVSKLGQVFSWVCPLKVAVNARTHQPTLPISYWYWKQIFLHWNVSNGLPGTLLETLTVEAKVNVRRNRASWANQEELKSVKEDSSRFLFRG